MYFYLIIIYRYFGSIQINLKKKPRKPKNKIKYEKKIILIKNCLKTF